MIQFNVHPDNYSEEEIVEIKRVAMIDNKIGMLIDTLEAIKELADDDSKLDLECKISQKLSRLIDKV